MAAVHKRLKNDAWSIMPNDQKIALLSDLERETAAKEKRQPLKISVDKMPGIFGKFDAEKGIIISETALKDAGRAINTLYHERRHGYQWEAINSQTSVPKDIVMWTKNWFAYINPNEKDTEFFEYFLQPIEKDANDYAIKMVSKLARKVNDEKLNRQARVLKATAINTRRSAEAYYGKDYEKKIQDKVNSLYLNSESKNSYQAVNERLSKEGIKIRPGFIDYIIPLGAQAQERQVKEGTTRDVLNWHASTPEKEQYIKERLADLQKEYTGKLTDIQKLAEFYTKIQSGEDTQAKLEEDYIAGRATAEGKELRQGRWEQDALQQFGTQLTGGKKQPVVKHTATEKTVQKDAKAKQADKDKQAKTDKAEKTAKAPVKAPEAPKEKFTVQLTIDKNAAAEAQKQPVKVQSQDEEMG